jgi:hypothetical protein
LEADLVLQFITVLFFSSSLIIVFNLFLFFYLGVLRGWWRKGGELVAEEWSIDGSGWMAFSSYDQVPSFYTSFSFFGVEMLMEVEGFSIPLLALKARGMFPSFLLSLPFSLFC